MYRRVIKSVQMLIEEVAKDLLEWTTTTPPWFRGEPRKVKTPLIPKLFRKEHDELKLLQHFRMKAPSLGLPYIPPREATDQWLFLAQHVRLPTRLLDWTSGLLIALHFALYPDQGKGAIVWMLNPVMLNRKTQSNFPEDGFPLTWFSRRNQPIKRSDLIFANWILAKTKAGDISPLRIWQEDIGLRLAEALKIEKSRRDEFSSDLLRQLGFGENAGLMNIRMAWEKNFPGNKYPFAVHPTNIHPRMSSQASRFTIHGNDTRGMKNMRLHAHILKKYVIGERSIPKVKKELRMMGITHSSLFPELDGLSDELAEIY